jgi:hypothetical protein
VTAIKALGVTVASRDAWLRAISPLFKAPQF